MKYLVGVCSLLLIAQMPVVAVAGCENYQYDATGNGSCKNCFVANDWISGVTGSNYYTPPVDNYETLSKTSDGVNFNSCSWSVKCDIGYSLVADSSKYTTACVQHKNATGVFVCDKQASYVYKHPYAEPSVQVDCWPCPAGYYCPDALTQERCPFGGMSDEGMADSIAGCYNCAGHKNTLVRG